MFRPKTARAANARRFTPAAVEGLEARALLSHFAAVHPRSAHVAQFVNAHARRSARPRRTAAPKPAVGFAGYTATVILNATAAPPARPPASTTPGAASNAPYTPAQIRHAYGFDKLNLNGAGQVIAIVDAFDNPTIARDLHAFDVAFGLPDPTLIKATPVSGTPAFNPGWADEIALDVEWAHAIAPLATILLVEASSASYPSLLSAVDFAVLVGVKQVSMSWGGPATSGVAAYDVHFNHPGVSFTSSSGDNGAGAGYPAASPFVTAVGGTSLTLDALGNRLGEAAWSGSGGGTTTAEPTPFYQAGLPIGTSRGVPDVSYNADPNTGFSVYNSSYGGGWSTIGGTSAGAPQWAALFALVNQGRAALGKPSLGTNVPAGTNTVLYSLAGGSSYSNARGDFLDITSGFTGYWATGGWDRATGLGSPAGWRIVPDLINS